MRDHRFVQFAFLTPERLRLRGNVSKFIHRQALRDLLPDLVRERTDKAEFSLVFSKPLCEINAGVMWADRAGEKAVGHAPRRGSALW